MSGFSLSLWPNQHQSFHKDLPCSLSFYPIWTLMPLLMGQSTWCSERVDLSCLLCPFPLNKLIMWKNIYFFQFSCITNTQFFCPNVSNNLISLCVKVKSRHKLLFLALLSLQCCYIKWLVTQIICSLMKDSFAWCNIPRAAFPAASAHVQHLL